MAIPSLEEFKDLAGQGNLIPVYEEVHFDWETPISAFRKIEDGKFSFLLESVEGGEKWGRYSFLGSGPSHLFRSKGEEFEILKNGRGPAKGEKRRTLSGPWRIFSEVSSRCRMIPCRDFSAGRSVMPVTMWSDL